MSGIIFVTIAITLNVSAQVLLKYSSDKILPISFYNIYIYSVFLALLLYACSFVVTIKIYALYPLSVISPIMAGLTIIMIAVSGVLIFSESLSLNQIFGVIMTIAGIVLLSSK